MSNPTTINARTLRRWLDALAIDYREPQTWQVFADSKRARVRPTHRHGRARDVLPWLNATQRAGGGVFMTINATTGGRRAEDVTRVRALFVDLDTPQDMPTWHCDPACVVESSPGKWHAYWTVADDMPLEAFRTAQERLARLYGGDSACKDLSRVLRVPGGFNLKADPQPVRLAYVGPWGIYPWRAILEGVPDLPAAMPAPSAETIARLANASRAGTRDGIDVGTLDVVGMFADAGLLLDVRSRGGYGVICPWSAEHSGDSAPTASMIWPAGARGALPGFKCMHAHCDGRGLRDVMRLFRDVLPQYAKPAPTAAPGIKRAASRLARLRGRS
jgi:hypothetical protein